jgi:DDE superfamily endonuclease
MWCIGALTEEYRKRMYDVLALYAQPYRKQEPVICIDEKGKQLIQDSRRPLAMKRGAPAKYDYEYVRAGTCNVFVAVEPKGGRRVVEVTERRTKPEFVGFVQQLLQRTYGSARKVHLVLDNLNTHFRSCFEEVLGRSAARALLQRVQFHHTPKHASWLNMAEIEISILQRQCLGRRLMDRATARREVNAWQRQRNAERRGIDWTFTCQDADRRLARHYVS